MMIAWMIDTDRYCIYLLLLVHMQLNRRHSLQRPRRSTRRRRAAELDVHQWSAEDLLGRGC